MALSVPSNLDSTWSTSNTTSLTCGSISPTADALLLVFIVSYQSNPAAANFFDGCTDTLTGTGSWTLSANYYQESTDSVCVGIYTAIAGSSPGSGTITPSWDDASSRNFISVFEVTGHDTTTPIVQGSGNGGSSSTLTVTLGASPNSANMVFGAVASSLHSGGITPGTGFSELLDYDPAEGAGNVVSQLQYDYQSADTTCDWSGLNTNDNSGVAIEIAEAAGAATGNPWYAYAQQ